MNHYITALFFGLVLLIGCNFAAQDKGSVSLEAFAQRDFADAIEHSSVVSDTEESHMNWNLTSGPHLVDELPHAERMQIGGWLAPDGTKVTLLQTFLFYAQYEAEEGEPPTNAVQLAHSLASKESPSLSLEELAELPLDQLPRWSFCLINPQTGKLYSSFDGSIKEPGAVKVHRLVDEADAKRAFGERPGWQHFNKTRVGYEITVLGADLEVLDTACVLQSSEELETAQTVTEESSHHQ